MSLILTGLLVVQVLSALTIIVLVLLQQGKGADMGSAFGGGSAGSLFGAAGAANFLSRATKWAAVLFFAVTVGLAYVSHNGSRATQQPSTGVMEGYQDPSVPVMPGVGGDAAVPQAPSAADVPVVPAPAPEVQSAPVPSAPAPQAQPAAPAEPAPAAEAPVAPAAPAEQPAADAGQDAPAPAESAAPAQEGAASTQSGESAATGSAQ